MKVSLAALEAFACTLLRSAGMPTDKAEVVGRLLVLTDGLGRRTHGLAMLPLYLAEIAKGEASDGVAGGMALHGAVDVVQDNTLCAVWDARYLPGLWVMAQALSEGSARARQQGMAAYAIRRTHHVGCLAALVKQAADQGLVAMVFNSDPSGQRVAPFGGKRALFTPNPYAIGYPGAGHPVLVDTCASITSTSMTRQKVAEGVEFQHPWLLDSEGQPTTDPRVLEHSTPRGSLQLTGGVDHGHKGFGLTLMIEALSQGLSGHGRVDDPKRWGGNVFLQIIDPRFFAGLDAFERQAQHVVQACRANPPIDTTRPVRVPGDQAETLWAQAKAEGLSHDAATVAALVACARQWAVPCPWPSGPA